MKRIIKNIAQSKINTATAINSLRLPLPAALIFTTHGAQKLFGAFGGYCLEGSVGRMDSIRLTQVTCWPYWQAVPSFSEDWPCC